MSLTIGEYVDAYIKIRDKRSDMRRQHLEELAPLNKGMLSLETMFQQYMNDNGLDSLKAGGGTAYQSTVNSVTVMDWDAFLGYIKAEDAFYLLDKRASKTAVMDIVDDTGVLPPGLNLNRSIKVNVRRS